MKKRDHKKYTLKKGNEILYVGVTDDPERREQEHKEEGKKFSHMKIEGRPVTKEGALEWEQERVEKYQKTHGGEKPKYNK